MVSSEKVICLSSNRNFTAGFKKLKTLVQRHYQSLKQEKCSRITWKITIRRLYHIRSTLLCFLGWGRSLISTPRKTFVLFPALNLRMIQRFRVPYQIVQRRKIVCSGALSRKILGKCGSPSFGGRLAKFAILNHLLL